MIFDASNGEKGDPSLPSDPPFVSPPETMDLGGASRGQHIFGTRGVFRRSVLGPPEI